MVEPLRSARARASERQYSLGLQGPAQRPDPLQMIVSRAGASKKVSSHPATTPPAGLQTQSVAIRDERSNYRDILRRLKALVARIDLSHFPGSCCG
jgi:hypothetical protein